MTNDKTKKPVQTLETVELSQLETVSGGGIRSGRGKGGRGSGNGPN